MLRDSDDWKRFASKNSLPESSNAFIAKIVGMILAAKCSVQNCMAFVVWRMTKIFSLKSGVGNMPLLGLPRHHSFVILEVYANVTQHDAHNAVLKTHSVAQGFRPPVYGKQGSNWSAQ